MVSRPAPAIVQSGRLPTKSPSTMAERMSVLVYGRPGVGKTVFGGSAALDSRSAPVLICDAEGGTLPVSHIADTALQIYSLDDFGPDLNRLVEWLRDVRDNSRETPPFKTLVLDSLTEVADRVMTAVLANPMRKSQSDTPDYADWNVWTLKMRSIIKELRDAPLHLIVTALEEEDDGKIGPMFPGRKLASVLAGQFNTVARLVVVPVPAPDGKSTKAERRLILQPDGRSMAKDRTDRLGTLPPMIANPTVSSLLDRMAEGHKIAQAATKKDK